MATAEELYSASLHPEDMEREGALSAYVMTKALLGYNVLLIQGVQPVDAAGEPLGVNYKSDAQILDTVTEAYGKGGRVVEAIDAAYKKHYEEQLNKE